MEGDIYRGTTAASSIGYIRPATCGTVSCLCPKAYSALSTLQLLRSNVLCSNFFQVHNQARDSMTALMDYIRVTTTRLNVEVDSLDSLRYVMVVLKEVRERESSIEMEITPILDMYQMLEHYLPGGLVDKVRVRASLRSRTL